MATDRHVRAEGRDVPIGNALASWSLALLCGALTFFAFLPAVDAELVNLDDDWNIAFNPSFQGLSARHLQWMLTTSSPMGHYQPLTWLSYALDFTLFGHRPESYHRTNVLLHCGVAIAFYWLAATLFSTVRRQASTSASGSRAALQLAAALSALLFAVHPLRVESVAWATGRNDLLSGGFAVLSATAWLRYGERNNAVVRWRVGDAFSVIALAAAAFGLSVSSLDFSNPTALGLRSFGGLGLFLGATCSVLLVLRTLRARGVRQPVQRPIAYGASCLFLLLSFLCKPWAIGLPILFLVLDAWTLRRMDALDAEAEKLPRSRAWKDLVLEKLPFLVLCGVFAVIARWAKHDLPILVKTDQTLAERIGQAFYGLVFYPLKTLWPSRLVAIRDLPDEISLTMPRFLLPALGVLAFTIALVLLRKRATAIVVAFACFGLLVAPALGFVQFNTLLVADRYSYVACMPFALLAGGGWLLASGQRRVERDVLAVLPIAAVAALFVATWRQSAVWKTSESLYLHALKFGESSRVLCNLALVYNERSREDPARRAEWLDTALALSTRAMELAQTSGLYEPQYRLTQGTVLLNRGDLDLAIAELRAFVAAKPDYAQGQVNLGLALLRLGRFSEARPVLELAVTRAGENPDAWRLLGLALEGEGNRPAAIQAYRRSLELDPGNPTSRDRLRGLEDGR